MGLFDALSIAGSGMGVNRVWLDALSDNIANANTVKKTSESAYQARYVRVQESGEFDGGGVKVTAIDMGPQRGRLTYQPEHPLADAQGYVQLPDMDMSTQMTSLIMAQRGYQANLAVINRAKEAYEAAIAIGRS
jgi:flagellar basal-body rod protein FlgC